VKGLPGRCGSPQVENAIRGLSESVATSKKIILAVLGSLILYAVFTPRHNGMPYKKLETQKRLNRLVNEVKMEAIGCHSLPDADIAKVIAWLGETMSERQAAVRREGQPWIESGLEAWDQPIVVRIDDGGIFILRSVGENGIDERGKGDDIQDSVDCRKYLR
jgi:hypothetical protein